MYDSKKTFNNPVCKDNIRANSIDVKNISVKSLVEFTDKKFSRLSGRDQPFYHMPMMCLMNCSKAFH